MAIGTGLALLGAAAITAGGAALSAKSSNKAISQASDSSLQATRESNAVQERIYGQNQAALAPFMERGNVAGGAIMELLGYPGQPANGQPQTGQQGGALASYAPQGQPQTATGRGFLNPTAGPAGWRVALQNEPGFGFQPPASFSAPQPQGGVATAAPSARSAFDTYLDSSGYQFRLGEGMDALNSGYAAQGLLESGAAQKALVRYGQDYGSNEFGRYMGYLTNQQGVGLSGASALAGVGQNYANSVGANLQNAGDTAANVALARGNVNQQMYGSIAGAFGSALGSLGSSYGPPKAPGYPGQGTGVNAPWYIGY